MYRRVWIERMGCNMAFDIPSHQERRLRNNCFRGQNLRKAGNFRQWGNAEQMFDDERFRTRLFEAIARATRGVDLRSPSTLSLTVDYGDDVGWASTLPHDRIAASSCEKFSPNKRTVALRVRRDEPFLAPATSLVTLVIEFGKGRGGLTAKIHTIYPGPYVGQLRATEPGESEPVDITARENVVFFDWNHEGEPLAS